MILLLLWVLWIIGLTVGTIISSAASLRNHHFQALPIILLTLLVASLITHAALLWHLHNSVSAFSQAWQQNATLNTDHSLIYVAVGDSAAQSIGASSFHKGYVQLVADKLAAETGKPVRIINIARSGAKLQDVINEQIPKLRNLYPDLVTIDVGANDISGGTPQTIMSRDYKRITTMVKSYPVILANLPDFMWGTQQRNTASLNFEIAQLCRQNGVQMADLHKVTKQTMWHWNEFAADGFHPSDAGYRTWASAFTEAMPKLAITRGTKNQ